MVVDSGHPFSVVDSDDELTDLDAVLQKNPWLRAAQVISSLRVTEEGSQRGYGAQLVFQSSLLSDPPVEVRLGAIFEMTLQGAEEARWLGAHKNEVGFRLRLRGGQFTCETLAYRMLPRGETSDPGEAMH